MNRYSSFLDDDYLPITAAAPQTAKEMEYIKRINRLASTISALAYDSAELAERITSFNSLSWWQRIGRDV